MKIRSSFLLGIVAIVVASAISISLGGSASATGTGAATGLKLTAESCTNGLATYRLTWTPSYKAAQRVDLSATNNNFASNYSSGQLDANGSAVLLTALKPGTTY